jgi:hypothetical protein
MTLQERQELFLQKLMEKLIYWRNSHLVHGTRPISYHGKDDVIGIYREVLDTLRTGQSHELMLFDPVVEAMNEAKFHVTEFKNL